MQVAGIQRFIVAIIAALSAGFILPPITYANETSSPVTVVELFTSHGCSSCPPADALLETLIHDHPDLIALEFHVDYWNDLVHGADGSWEDPFSDAAYTDRQRRYAAIPLAGQRGVYTPQIIVNGHYAAVGSDAPRIRSALAQPLRSQVGVSIASTDRGFDITVDSPETLPVAFEPGVYLVTYRHHARTDITAGENRHRTLDNHHIVTGMVRLGSVEPGASQSFSVNAGSAGFPASPAHGCAVLVQDVTQSALYGAARCP